MVREDLIWDKDEYNAIVDYKANYYSAINVLLSNGVTLRELNGKPKKLPQTPEELKKAIETAVLVYSAIKKNHILNGSKESSKTLFRGTRDGKIDMSFLSTSDSAKTAFDFAKMFEQMGKGNGTLLAIDSGSTPWIDIGKILPSGDGIEEEPEILFLPSQIENFEQISLQECFDIAKNQGEKISTEQAILKKFDTLRCGKVSLSELEYDNEEYNTTLEGLCEEFGQYKQDLDTIKTAEKSSQEYNEAFKRASEFKSKCCSYLHQRFSEISKDIDIQANLDNNIHLSPQCEMSEVSIGNTGTMYEVKDKQMAREYYFKPAISKSGEDRPYRAYIQESAYQIQQIINPGNAVKCNTTEISGVFGAVQEKIPIDKYKTKAFTDYFDRGIGELSPEIISQIMDEYLVDFCLCNYDAHASNFIIDRDGKLRGIDKEQSFRYIKEDSERDMMFSENYNERYGENPTIYTTIFEQMKQRKISYKYLDILRYRASRLAQFPDEEYKKIFESYARGKAKSPEEIETLLSSIMERKSNILENVEQLYNGIYNEYDRNKLRANYKSILKSAVQATEETTRTGTINEQVSNIVQLTKGKDEKEKGTEIG